MVGINKIVISKNKKPIKILGKIFILDLIKIPIANAATIIAATCVLTKNMIKKEKVISHILLFIFKAAYKAIPTARKERESLLSPALQKLMDGRKTSVVPSNCIIEDLSYVTIFMLL
ncbi:hypothetical protein GCM10011450_24240 [Advenella faeciporci]|uniref:Uncharacterized protein n=1 Tax=Advenella faeciporci TaxID=797535 RepID=A0A918JPZ5_9BURK|nr:hypothetical protein GCM10011450_24240 [Advenella faeciporci]